MRKLIIAASTLGGFYFFQEASALESWNSIHARFETAHMKMDLPRFPNTLGELRKRAKEAMSQAQLNIENYVHQDLKKLTFESAVRALDGLTYDLANLNSEAYLIKETHPSSDIREEAANVVEELESWFIDYRFRDDVFGVLNAFNQQNVDLRAKRPDLSEEDFKYYDDMLREYKKRGFLLSPEIRREVSALMKSLSETELSFQRNISEAHATLRFSKEELKGIPDSFLESIKTPEGDYAVKINVTYHYTTVLDHCQIESTRQKVSETYHRIAQDKNEPLLNEMIRLRDQIAHKLGYQSWADYKIDGMMAETSGKATKFLTDLRSQLHEKFEAEKEALRLLKAQDTNDPRAQLQIWDMRYYQERLRQKSFNIDTEALREYFSMEDVLEGVFDIYRELFGIEIQEFVAPEKYVADLRSYAVFDKETGTPLGVFYLDLFPRDGKYNHFAHFSVTEAKKLSPQEQRRPLSFLVCNFPSPTLNTPSLLTHDNVETLLHEFGHLMHAMLTQAHYALFSGTSVERDFVEAPSQAMEAWAWDINVLTRFARSYKDPSKRLPEETIRRMKEAKLATIATFYRRQLGYALSDQAFHEPGGNKNSREIANREMAASYFPPPDGSNFAAFWGHMAGYDGTYYGYAWADAIASDMTTPFGDQLMNSEVGRRLRGEVYSRGGSRTAERSIREFLGRPWNCEAFLRSIGLGK